MRSVDDIPNASKIVIESVLTILRKLDGKGDCHKYLVEFRKKTWLYINKLDHVSNQQSFFYHLGINYQIAYGIYREIDLTPDPIEKAKAYGKLVKFIFVDYP